MDVNLSPQPWEKDSPVGASMAVEYRNNLDKMLATNHGMSFEDLTRDYSRMRFTEKIRSRILSAYEEAIALYQNVGVEVLAKEMGISESTLRARIKGLRIRSSRITDF